MTSATSHGAPGPFLAPVSPFHAAPGIVTINQSTDKMLPHSVLCSVLVLFSLNGDIFAADPASEGAAERESAQLAAGEHALSEQVLRVLEHFQQPHPQGLPGVHVPDPYPIPDMKHSFPMANMNFKNVKTRGLSKFRIVSVRTEIAAMEVRAAMKIDKLLVAGDYVMSTWLSRSHGPFTVNLTDIFVEGVANLAIERDGKLRAQDILMDITFRTISMNFENLGFFASIFQGMLNSVGTFLFDSIKPFVLKEAYAKIRTEINDNLDKVAGDMQFPNSISPLDMVIADARAKVRDMGYDPYRVQDYNSTVGLFGVTLTHTWLTGVSSFHRVGDITLRMENDTLVADFEVGTQKLEGRTQWDVAAVGGVVSRAGTASFSVEYLSARVVLAQPLDTRRRPQFRDLQLELGNVQVRCDGAGTLDYVVELVVNVLPNLLRYQITDAVEGPILEKGQQQFDKIDTEALIRSKLPELEKVQGFKLSSVLASRARERPVDDDDFFNF